VLLLVLAAMQFLHIVDFVIIMPLGPTFQGALGITVGEFGWFVSAYGFSASATGLFAARLLDRFDRKKSQLVLFVGFTAGTLLCALAPNFPVLVLARAVTGAFAGVMGANVLAIVSDVFPESRRATAMGVVMSSFSVASVVGIFAGLEVAEVWGWRGPFLVLAVLCLPALLLGWRVLPPLRRHLECRPARAAGLLEILLQPRHLRAYALTAALMMGSWTIIPFLAIFLVNNLHWAETSVKWVWVVGGVATFLTMTPTGWVADSRDKLRVFRVIGVFCVVPVLLITNLPADSPVALALLATTLFMVVTSIRWVPGMAMISACAAPQQRGSFMSVNASVQQMVMGLAPLVSGLMLGQKPEDGGGQPLEGFPLVGLLAAASMIASVLLAGRLRRAPAAQQGPPAREVVAEAAEVVAF
jgi:predicted MFS family arabinose efflux permease